MHLPIRTCIVCRCKKPKKELLRIIEKDDSFILDSTQKISAKGFYICNNKDCTQNIVKKKALSRYKKTNISTEKHTQLVELINKNINK